MSSVRRVKSRLESAADPVTERTVEGIRYTYKVEHGGWLAAAPDITAKFFECKRTACLRFYQVQKIKLSAKYKFKGDGQKGQSMRAIDATGINNIGKLNKANYESKTTPSARAKFDAYRAKYIVNQNGVLRINLPERKGTPVAETVVNPPPLMQVVSFPVMPICYALMFAPILPPRELSGVSVGEQKREQQESPLNVLADACEQSDYVYGKAQKRYHHG